MTFKQEATSGTKVNSEIIVEPSQEMDVVAQTLSVSFSTTELKTAVF